MVLATHIAMIIFANGLDALLGDPVYRLHPIRLLGYWSLAGERALFAMGLNGYFGGIVHGLLVGGGGLFAWWSIHHGLEWLHPWAAWSWDVFIAYSLLCLRDLLTQGRKVLNHLADLPTARAHLTALVSRDTTVLERAGVVRAAIESLAENLTDGVLTPLWALCLFGLPGLLVVKAISNLDSMVGYQTPRYQRFGWAAARADDLIHWLPARLSPLLIAAAAGLLNLHPWSALKTAWRDHAVLPSPNSGWSEAACAGALQVRLVGPLYYGGQLVQHAYLGAADWPTELQAIHLQQALQLIGVAGLLALLIGLAGAPWALFLTLV